MSAFPSGSASTTSTATAPGSPAAGLAGHLEGAREAPVPWTWVPAAALASLAGSWLGARHLTGQVLRRCLSVVLLLTAIKLLRLAASA